MTISDVLVVDDLEQNLTALEALLTAPDVRVLRARSGLEALEVLLEHDVAVALLDVQMPQMDGFELAEILRSAARTRDIPIIFVTAAGRDPERLFRGYEAGAVDFICKPVDAEILKRKVEVFVRLHRQKAQLAAQLAALARLLRLNETFTAVLGHDLRNPLNSIVGNAEVQLRTSTDPTTVASASRIRASAGRMARMIDQLLDLSRLRAGQLEIHVEPADLLELVRSAIDEARSAVSPQADVTLAHQGDSRGAWDVDRLGQVLSNLLGNALSHGVRGTPVAVEIDARDADGVTISVRNRGAIPAELLPHVFEPYRQGGPRRSDAPAGLGLGLHIVEQLVSLHGGRVQVESTEADGTCFDVWLPRRTEPATASSPSWRN